MIDTENINNFGIVPQYWFIDTSSMTLCCHGGLQQLYVSYTLINFVEFISKDILPLIGDNWWYFRECLNSLDTE